ncbi:MAG TPA: putative toxin-antitoxin system toxin component, PIN family [Bryobacteraceae bacterium]|nr:putative toxin-antitoxin system toxin component, PIN family [Bryobacteraceae bacterium]
MIKAVLDTNVVVSACWKPGGLEASAVALAAQGAFTLCVSPAIVAEYRDVLSRKKLANLESRAVPLLAALEKVWISFDASIRTSAAGDEDDNRFLECAFSSGANFLVTGNLRHYPETFATARIVNARAFLAECFAAELQHIDCLISAPSPQIIDK